MPSISMADRHSFLAIASTALQYTFNVGSGGHKKACRYNRTTPVLKAHGVGEGPASSKNLTISRLLPPGRDRKAAMVGLRWLQSY